MFDWDGTLYNSLMLAYGSVIKIFKTYNKPPPSLDAYRDEITADFMQFYWKHDIPRNVTGHDLNKIRKRYFEEHKKEASPNAWVESVLKQGRVLNIPRVIVSAGVSENLNQQLKDSNLLPLVTRVRGDAWDKEKALLEVLDFFGVQAENAFYLDDTYDGLVAAKKCGIVAIGYTGKSAYNSERRIIEAADYTVSSLWHLLPIIRCEARA